MSQMNKPMTAEQLAVIADDIADMANDFIVADDAKSLRNMASNLANMIRIHDGEKERRLEAIRQWAESDTLYVDGRDTAVNRSLNLAYARAREHARALLTPPEAT